MPAEPPQPLVLSERAVANSDPLFADAVAAVARKLDRVDPLDAAALPSDRLALADALDRWAGDDTATWRRELRRHYEQHLPVYVRPDAGLNAVLRALAAGGVRIGVWSPGPAEAVDLLLAHVGVARILTASGHGGGEALATLADALGGSPLVVVATGAEAVAARRAGMACAAAGWAGAGDIEGCIRLQRPHDLLTATGAP